MASKMRALLSDPTSRKLVPMRSKRFRSITFEVSSSPQNRRIFSDTLLALCLLSSYALVSLKAFRILQLGNICWSSSATERTFLMFGERLLQSMITLSHAATSSIGISLVWVVQGTARTIKSAHWQASSTLTTRQKTSKRDFSLATGFLEPMTTLMLASENLFASALPSHPDPITATFASSFNSFLRSDDLFSTLDMLR